jgi:sulfonate transport system substrate-binding protein
MTTRVGYFPQNNSLWVLRHRDILTDVEWVDFRTLPRERVEFVKEQQHAADLFGANGLIDRDITVADAVLDDVNDLVAATL